MRSTNETTKLNVNAVYKNKKYVLSNSESVQCKFFIFDRVTFIQLNLLLCTKFHENWMIFTAQRVCIARTINRCIAIYRFTKWRPSAILELF